MEKLATPAQEPTKTKLSRNYTFWLTINAAETQNYEDAIKKIGTFDTVEDFWAIYQHLKRPDDIPAKIDYNLVH
jgi:translation initiation factor 4E